VVSMLADREEAHRALALALMRADKWQEAEQALRRAICVVDEARRWRMRLVLSHVLVRRGDEAKDRTYYEEALRHVNSALQVRPGNEEIYFYAGVINFKLEDYNSARKSFESCLRKNPSRFDAERNIALATQRVREVRKVNRINLWGGVVL